MSSTTVKWKVTSEDDAAFRDGTSEQTTILPGFWAAHDGTHAAESVCEDYFDDDAMWLEYFGDGTKGRVRVRVTEPQSIAATYLVQLRRTAKADARAILKESG